MNFVIHFCLCTIFDKTIVLMYRFPKSHKNHCWFLWNQENEEHRENGMTHAQWRAWANIWSKPFRKEIWKPSYWNHLSHQTEVFDVFFKRKKVAQFSFWKKKRKHVLGCETIDSVSFLSETRVERPVHRTRRHTRSTQFSSPTHPRERWEAWWKTCMVGFVPMTRDRKKWCLLLPFLSFFSFLKKKEEKRRKDTTWILSTPKSNYELFNCSNFNICYWSWNYRGCWHQTCPPIVPRRERDLNWTHSDCKPFLSGFASLFLVTTSLCQDWVICAPAASLEVVAVSQAPSPESNPNSPSPVITMVGLDPTIESW